ncbi:MAG: hypothetical protein ABIN97_09790, partial [Ginsengibacter sp.]
MISSIFGNPVILGKSLAFRILTPSTTLPIFFTSSSMNKIIFTKDFLSCSNTLFVVKPSSP